MEKKGLVLHKSQQVNAPKQEDSANWKKHKSLWREIKSKVALYFVARDFNCITNSIHKRGGNAFCWGLGETDLLNLINYCGFSEITFSDNSFTWCNNQPERARIWERLDYVLANPAWVDTNFNSYVEVLKRVVSYHNPILFSIADDQFYGKHIFRFEDF